MMYDSYKQKILRLKRFIDKIIKYKAYILTIIGIILALVISYMSLKGVVYNKDFSKEQIYGSFDEPNAKAFFSDTWNEYYSEEEGIWTFTKPVYPGEYKMRIGSTTIFGNTRYSDDLIFEIIPATVDFHVDNADVVYGNKVNVSADLKFDDKLIEYDVEYENILNATTNVEVIPETVKIINSLGEDVTSAYVVKPISREIYVYERQIEIEIFGATKEYDGTPLYCDDFSIISGDLGTDDRIEMNIETSIIDVGEIENNVFEIAIYNGDLEVTKKYKITYVYNDLVITKRKVSILSNDFTDTYDGTLKNCLNYKIIDGSIPESDSITVIDFKSYTEAGSYENILVYQVFNKENKDVTNNYEFTLSSGTITILKRDVVIKPQYASKIYDGLAISTNESEITGGSLVEGHQVEMIACDDFVDAGRYDNKIESIRILKDDLDLTANYNITTELGVLEIFKRELRVKTNDSSKVYDDTYLVYDEYEILDGTLVEGDNLTIETVLNAFNVGVYENIVNKHFINNTNKDVTDNYDVKFEYGTLEVTKRPITIKPYNKIDVYTDKELYSNDVEIIEGTIIKGHVITIETDGRITEVGSCGNKITNYIITKNDLDITYNYDVSLEEGTLEVYAQKIKVKPLDASKVYDDTILISNEAEVIDGILIDGHKIIIETNGVACDVGKYENKIESLVIKKDDIDVTKNYEVTTERGTLKISERYVKIKPVDKSKVYDGTEFSSNEVELLDETTLVNGHELIIEADGLITNYGSCDNNVTSYKVIKGEKDVTVNYNIETVTGSLSVEQRPITIKSYDAEKVYDDTPLVNEKVEITEGSLALGEVIDTLTFQDAIDVGEYENTIIWHIYRDNVDVTFNYDVTTEFGLLVISERYIKIKPVDKSKVYDGMALESSEFELLDETTLAVGHELFVETDGSITNVGECDNSITDYLIFKGDKNVTSNYVVDTVTGTLTVEIRKITIKTFDAEKVYDDTPLVNERVDIILGSLAYGEYIDTLTFQDAIDAGEYLNTVNYNIYKGNEDVTNNYEVTTELGTLRINVRYIKIKLIDMSKIYDGKELRTNEVEFLNNTSIVAGHELVIEADGSITKVGVCDNNITSYKILKDEKDVTINYDVETVKGLLTIEKRPITIKSLNAMKEYDDTPLINDRVEIVRGSLAEGENLVTEVFKDAIDVGTYVNSFTWNIYRDSENVSDNYDVTKLFGELTITPRYIAIKPVDITKIYDAKELKSNKIEFLYDTSIVSGHELIVETDGSITNVGTIDNNIISYSIIKGNKDVTYNYEVDTIKGSLTIEKRPITIKSFDSEKVYDDTPLINDRVEIILGELVEGQVLITSTYQDAIDAGTYKNTIIWNIYDGLDDVSFNYDVSTILGTLVITERYIKVKPIDLTKVYDGKVLLTNEFEVLDGSLVAGHIMYVNTDGAIIDVGTIDNNIISYQIIKGSRNVSHNYYVETVAGSLTIEKRPITLMSYNAEKIYDDTPLINNRVDIISGSLADGDELDATTRQDVVDAGVYENTIDWNIYRNGKNKSFNYDVTTVLGILKIKERYIKIKLIDVSKVYDGLVLTSNVVEFVDGTSIVDGHDIVIEADGAILDAGSCDNNVTRYQILKGDRDITYNYIVETVKGKLIIEKRLITIKPVDVRKEYDGEYLISDLTEVIDGSLPDNHQLICYTDGFLDDIGLCENNIVYYEIMFNGKDVSYNFIVTKEAGILEIIKRNLRFKPVDIIKEYDGIPLSSDEIEFLDGTSLVNGHELIVETNGYIEGIGSCINSVIDWKILYNNKDYADKYNVEIEDGYLEVKKRHLEIKPADASKFYDGLPLTSNAVEIINGSLLDGHTIEIITDGYIVEVGICDNYIIDYLITCENIDVTDFYDVYTMQGYLQIYEAPSFDGSGMVLFRFTANTDIRIYLRQRSYGDYNFDGNFSEGIPYVSDSKINPMYLTTKALLDAGKIPSKGEIEVFVDGLSFMLPYYTVNAPNGDYNDVYIDGDFDIFNDYEFLIYDYEQDGIFKHKDQEYIDFEKEYREFVYENYLSIPDSTKDKLLEIAKENNIDKNSPTLIEEVKYFIQNAATYNLEYPQMPAGEDLVIYFLTESKEGVCTHYSKAATMMYRALGLPARYVEGFAGEVEVGYWTNFNIGHAWTEVYIDGMGWIPVEVTGSGNIDIEPGPGNEEDDIVDIPDGDNVIKIIPYNQKYVYTGEEFTVSNDYFYIMPYDRIPSNYKVELQITGALTDVGIIDTYIPRESIVIYNEFGENVTSNYDIYLETGTLEVVSGLIEVTAGSSMKEYDGTELTCDSFTITFGTLAEGHTIEVVIEGKITEVGTTENILKEVRIFNKLGKDVTRSCNIRKVNGILEIVESGG